MRKKLLAAALTAVIIALSSCGNTGAENGGTSSLTPENEVSDPSEVSERDSSSEEKESAAETSESPDSSDTEESAEETEPPESSEAPESPESPAEEESGTDGGKVLVAYFTNVQTDSTDADASASRVYRNGDLVGVTEYFAQDIAEYTGGDLFLIKGNDYPADYDATTEAANLEREENARPELREHIDNIGEYDVIFVGYPTWWTDMPMAVYSFFDEYDLAGKTVIPFNTHWGYGPADTFNTIAGLEPEAAVAEGLSLYNYDVENSADAITSWIDGLGIL